MAGVIGREIMMVIRAQNMASGVLRKVGADMAGLGKKEALSARRAQLGLQRQNLLNRQQVIRNQLAKEETGSSAIRRQIQRNALDTQRLKLTNSINASDTKKLSNARSIFDSESRLERLERYRASALSRQNSANASMGGITRGIQSGKISGRTDIADAKREYAGFASQAARAGTAVHDLNRDIESQKMNLNRLGFSLKDINAAQQAYRKSIGDTAANERLLVKQEAESAEKVAQHRANLTANVQALAQNTQKFKEMDAAEKAFKMERIGQATHLLGSMGRQLQLVGGAGAAALGFAAYSAAQLSTSVTLATTQYQDNVQKIKNASDVNFGFVLDQMKQFPSTAEDMSASLYDIFSTLNVNGPKGRDILEQVNKAAVAGQVSTQEATAGVLSILSNFKNIAQTGKGTEGALNRMFAAVRYGRVTMAEFSTSLQTTAPAANQTGQSFDNLAGSVAFLSRSLGISKASVGYARLLQQLTSTAMVSGLKQHGISVRDAAGHYKQLDQILGEITKKFPKLTTGQLSAQNFFKSISGTTGTIQGARAMTTLVKNMSGYRDILNKTTDDNNEFKKSYDALNQTAGVQFARALNVLKSLWLDLGRAAIPTIAGLLSPISELAKSLNDMDQATKDSIGRIVAIGVAITGVTGVVLSLVAALGGATLIFAALSGPMLLGVIAGLAGIGAAIYLIIDNWDSIKPRLIAFWPTVEASVKSAVSAIGNILSSLSNIIASVFGIIDAFIRSDWGDMWDSAVKAVTNFGNLIEAALNGVKAIFTGWLNLATSSVQGFAAAAGIAVLVAVKLASAIKSLATAYELMGTMALASRGGFAADAAGGGMAASLGVGLARARVAVVGLVSSLGPFV